jgi:FMN phosphatase YigB (HAD superfamily)
MKPRAIICDVYRTILEVLPPEGDAEDGWEKLGRDFFGTRPALSFAGFLAACREEVIKSHAASRRRGVAFPEVSWPAIVGTVIPDFRSLDPQRQMSFQVAEQALNRTLGFAPGAAAVLSRWVECGIPLGIASNAQAYTQPELGAVLAEAGLTSAVFAPDLVLWSWQLGFSKPDPYFFQVLLARLAARGIAPGEALMVGDRADNDIAPARAAGLMTWHLQAQGDGGWAELGSVLQL